MTRELLTEQALGRAIGNPTEQLSAGPEILAEFFNFMPIEAKKRVPDALAKRVGEFLIAAGYRLCFNRWYRQHKANFAQPQAKPIGWISEYGLQELTFENQSLGSLEWEIKRNRERGHDIPLYAAPQAPPGPAVQSRGGAT